MFKAVFDTVWNIIQCCHS